MMDRTIIGAHRKDRMKITELRDRIVTLAGNNLAFYVLPRVVLQLTRMRSLLESSPALRWHSILVFCRLPSDASLVS